MSLVGTHAQVERPTVKNMAASQLYWQKRGEQEQDKNTSNCSGFSTKKNPWEESSSHFFQEVGH